MKKNVTIIALMMTFVMTACTNENDIVEDSTLINPTAQAQTPIEFGTYIGRTATRGEGTHTQATTGSITTTDDLKKSTGFGVFAYSTGNTPWATARTQAKPNFMYNERIHWNTSTWEYWPLKFWPNDSKNANNAVDQQTTGGPATGTTTSYISFFAYAPYTGKDDDANNHDGSGYGTITGNTTGIIGISGNNDADDPTLTYVLSENDNVDLLWGTAEAALNYANSKTGTQAGGKVTEKGGTKEGLANVNIDLVKPKASDKITFKFKHALSIIGGSLESTDKKDAQNGLMVKLDINNDGEIEGGKLPAETYVTIKYISIVNDGTFNDEGITGTENNANKIEAKGILDLATGLWTRPATDQKIYQTLNHTISNSSTAANKLRDNIAEPEDKSKWQTDSKQDIAQLISKLDEYAKDMTDVTTAYTRGGVLADRAQNVYKASASPMVFIPGTTPHFKITVNYIVRTKDGKLESGYSEVEQTISKIVKFTQAIELNKKYNLIIHLGLTDVRFTATVSNWQIPGDNNEDGVIGEGETAVNLDVHIPQNVAVQ